jgi:probable F420-dependent oxidoreductase
VAYGITLPFDGVPLSDHRAWLEELVRLGYTDVWTSEASGCDAFTPLALAAAWAPSLRLGTAIVPAFTRGPAVLAQSVAAMAEAAPGRFSFGIGTSSDVIVERWNDIPFDQPYRRTRDLVRFLRQCLAGDRVDNRWDTFTVRGFRLDRPPSVAPRILIAGLRPGMLRLAGREADGAVINWLSASDVPQVVAEVGPGRDIVARIFVCPTEDTDLARRVGRRAVAAYLNVPVYAEFHRWLGRGTRLEAMWTAWAAGDRRGALAAIPDDVVDDLVLHGDPESIRERVGWYVRNGVTLPVLYLMGVSDLGGAIAAVGPRPEPRPT